MEWTGSFGDYLGASLMKLNHRNPVWNCSFPISLIKNGHFMSRIRCLLDSEGDTLGILLGFFGINRLDGRLFTVRKNRTLLSLDQYGWRQIVSNSYGTSHLIHPDRSVFSFLFFSFLSRGNPQFGCCWECHPHANLRRASNDVQKWNVSSGIKFMNEAHFELEAISQQIWIK